MYKEKLKISTKKKFNPEHEINKKINSTEKKKFEMAQSHFSFDYFTHVFVTGMSTMSRIETQIYYGGNLSVVIARMFKLYWYLFLAIL